MEGRADQGCLVQPLNFLLQWAWRFRCSGFGPTCLLYLFVFSLSSSSFPPNASSQLQMGCLPLPTARPQDLAALGLVWREHMHLPPGLCCCCSSLCQVAEGAVQHPSSSGNWKDPGGSEEGQWSAQVLLPGQRAIYTRNPVAGPWGPTAPGKFAWCMWAQSQSMQFRGNV